MWVHAMTGWEAAFWIVVTAVIAFCLGAVVGVRLERIGNDIYDGINPRKEDE